MKHFFLYFPLNYKRVWLFFDSRSTSSVKSTLKILRRPKTYWSSALIHRWCVSSCDSRLILSLLWNKRQELSWLHIFYRWQCRMHTLLRFFSVNCPSLYSRLNQAAFIPSRRLVRGWPIPMLLVTDQKQPWGTDKRNSFWNIWEIW